MKNTFTASWNINQKLDHSLPYAGAEVTSVPTTVIRNLCVEVTSMYQTTTYIPAHYSIDKARFITLELSSILQLGVNYILIGGTEVTSAPARGTNIVLQDALAAITSSLSIDFGQLRTSTSNFKLYVHAPVHIFILPIPFYQAVS